ncbi:hypothetical protein [Leptotrichia sp. oral taxon 847]|uniref:hypothetical protein n=1 Tax=Leptotrichia sp. oral taxon 847 TaxID=1785996 RepID=UPI0007684578|nr:hypothetical protein [Leptotrichia sp. oral taxon 847]AMD95872.1 hypothetical protein AXF11_09995 [Leptotrichia sp. oral taxon 847]
MRKKAIMIMAVLFLCQLSYAASQVEDVNKSNPALGGKTETKIENTSTTTTTTTMPSEKENVGNENTTVKENTPITTPAPAAETGTNEETTVVSPAPATDNETETTLKDTKRESITTRTNKTTKRSQLKSKSKAKKMTLDQKLDAELSNLTRMLDRLEGK